MKKTPFTGKPYSQERFLILTADDFGASLNINEGIEIAADKNAITEISVLSNFKESLLELKKIADNHPEIGIGVHLNITTGKPILNPELVPSLVDEKGNFFTLDELLPNIEKISLDELKKELEAQVSIMGEFNIKVDHLSDQNGVLSIYEPFFNVVVELAREHAISVRSPMVAGIKYPKEFPRSAMKKQGRKVAVRMTVRHPVRSARLFKYYRHSSMESKSQILDDFGISHTDNLIESFWGNPTTANFLHIIEHLPEGSSEIMLHFGTEARQKSYPSGLDIGYFDNREKELSVVTSEFLKTYIKYMNIRTVTYSEISIIANRQYALPAR